MSTPITLFTAFPLIVIAIILTVRVILYRRSHNIWLGDSGDVLLLRLMRAHGNFMEFAPLWLLLILILEINSIAPLAIYWTATILVAGRITHALALSSQTNRPFLRVIGMVGTIGALISGLAAIIWNQFF